ncbi:hypothetical protein [Albimonas pacifica]|uniref:Uncharacterized protein n=1 Tax=Albimonas pacifica TaxID=1114924 RepID=A0A1I3C0L0_9RHOB|nr:hypothetical protein [Albimonas pacifica]SFH68148.1 hypothetical protein SAMN05216258_101487 [Albimonas pacifica]
MAPSSRILLALAGVTAASLALVAALVFGGLDRLGLRSAEANMDFLLSQLRGSIEANVGLGLALPDVRVAQALVEQAKAADDRVLAVEVFSPAGVSLFNTDRGAVGEEIPEAWRRALAYRSVGDRWRVEELGAIVVGEAMRNDFDEPVGYVAVTISDAARASHADGLAAVLAARAAWLAPLALVLALGVAGWVLDRSTRDLRRLAAELSAAPPAGAAPSPAPAPAPAPAATTPGARVRAAADRAVAEHERAAADVLAADEA